MDTVLGLNRLLATIQVSHLQTILKKTKSTKVHSLAHTSVDLRPPSVLASLTRNDNTSPGTDCFE